MALDVPSAPLLATVPGVEIGSVGYWDISNALDWHPSAEDLADAVAALDCPAVRRPVLKFGHTGDPGEGDPSIGIVDRLRLSDDGQTLIGDFAGVPAWLASPDDDGRCVLASAYPDRSGEWQSNYVCQLGHTHPFVLHAVALLGVVRPGIGTLESLYDLYTKAPEKEPVMAKTAVALAGTTVDQIRSAFYDGGPGTNYLLWIREMFVDPPELIVCNDADDSMMRMPYTVAGDGDVEFADGQPVKVEYVNARAAIGKPVVAYASSTEARPKKQSVSTISVDAAEKGDGRMATFNPKDGLAQLLGLPADADDEAVQKAYDEAVAAKTKAPDDKPGDPAPVTEPAPAEQSLLQVAASAKKLGLTVLDEETAAKLTADASAGREAMAHITAQKHTAVVSSAIDDGKIPPARRTHYMGLMERDPKGTEEFLASLPKETSVPLTEMGHATEPSTEITDNPVYKEWKF